MNEFKQLTHDEATELCGLYVLDALDADESEAVRRHLGECTRPHPEFAEVGGVVPALAQLVQPLDAPPALRERVLAAVEAEAREAPAPAPTHAPPRPTRVWEYEPDGAHRPATTDQAARMPSRRPSWLAWTAVAASVLIIAALAGWNLVLQARADELEQRTALIAEAIAASSAPGADVAVMQGAGPAAGASGFAAFPEGGTGYILLVGLPPAPAGETYQAWQLVDGRPVSAGLLSIGADGYAILGGVERVPGAQLIALTIEPAGGVELPTADPIVTGQIDA